VSASTDVDVLLNAVWLTNPKHVLRPRRVQLLKPAFHSISELRLQRQITVSVCRTPTLAGPEPLQHRAHLDLLLISQFTFIIHSLLDRSAAGMRAPDAGEQHAHQTRVANARAFFYFASRDVCWLCIVAQVACAYELEDVWVSVKSMNAM
jgi:hypothetical protein